MISKVVLKANSHYIRNVTYVLTTLRSAVHAAFAHYVNFTLIKQIFLPYYN